MGTAHASRNPGSLYAQHHTHIQTQQASQTHCRLAVDTATNRTEMSWHPAHAQCKPATMQQQHGNAYAGGMHAHTTLKQSACCWRTRAAAQPDANFSTYMNVTKHQMPTGNIPHMTQNCHAHHDMQAAQVQCTIQYCSHLASFAPKVRSSYFHCTAGVSRQQQLHFRTEVGIFCNGLGKLQKISARSPS